MRRPTNKAGTFALIVRGSTAVAVLFFMLNSWCLAQAPAVKTVGTVKSISGNALVLILDASTDTTVTIADSARILRTLPGQTDLKAATPISASGIQVGDRVLARGQTGDHGTLVASSVIVMSKTDIAQRQQQEQAEWRKGIGGIVKSVESSAGTVTLANSLLASGKPIVVHIAQDTNVRRYATDSVKFDDAKPGTLDQIKAGDQLRARGIKSADGTEFTAQAIVSGSFKDIAGTVISTDAASNSVFVMDLATKKPVMVKVSSETQLRKLPPMVAQMIALRLKGSAPGAQPGQNATAPAGTGTTAGSSNGSGRGQGNWAGQSGTAGERIGSGGGAPGGNWRNGGGPPDFQQMLSRMPAATIADLNKGDAVMLVATEGSSNAGPTAITMLAGVEPILSAAPPGTSAVTLLSPWNLGTGAGAGGDASTQ